MTNEDKEFFVTEEANAEGHMAEKNYDDDTDCPCGDASNHNNGDSEGCVLGNIIRLGL